MGEGLFRFLKVVGIVVYPTTSPSIRQSRGDAGDVDEVGLM